jgi:tellurite resistance-related uncharacterized protein
LCDRAELPDGLALVRSSQEWDEATVPAGLLRAHRIAAGTWGRINVRHGQLRFVAQTEPALSVVMGPGSIQAIPPEVRHEVQPLGAVRFSIDFFSIRGPEPTVATIDEDLGGRDASTGAPQALELGGEAACWAHLLCPECGTVLDGGAHIQDCQWTTGE